jgi:hypothetical protein
MWRIMRFRTITGILAIMAGLCAATLRVEASIPPSQALDFAIRRGDSDIGRHVIDFRRDGDRLHVEIDIDIAVSVLFMTVFSYRHHNHEVWEDGRLMAIDTRTDDNGERYAVTGRAVADGFAVEGAAGSFVAPADIIPTSYWSPATMHRSVLLDTQHGRLLDVAITPMGPEQIDTVRGFAEAVRYDMSGDLDLTLWYTPAGEWVKIAFDARGERVEYRLRNVPPANLRAAR